MQGESGKKFKGGKQEARNGEPMGKTLTRVMRTVRGKGNGFEGNNMLRPTEKRERRDRLTVYGEGFNKTRGKDGGRGEWKLEKAVVHKLPWTKNRKGGGVIGYHHTGKM